MGERSDDCQFTKHKGETKIRLSTSSFPPNVNSPLKGKNVLVALKNSLDKIPPEMHWSFSPNRFSFITSIATNTFFFLMFSLSIFLCYKMYFCLFPFRIFVKGQICCDK
jgi:hypothetical protein